MTKLRTTHPELWRYFDLYYLHFKTVRDVARILKQNIKNCSKTLALVKQMAYNAVINEILLEDCNLTWLLQRRLTILSADVHGVYKMLKRRKK